MSDEKFNCEVCNEEFYEDEKELDAYEQFGFSNCCSDCYDTLKQDKR